VELGGLVPGKRSPRHTRDRTDKPLLLEALVGSATPFHDLRDTL